MVSTASKTYKIPADNWTPLCARLEKLTRRAVKLGRKIPLLTKVGETQEVVDAKRGIVRTFFEVNIDAEPVCVNDWEMVASIDMADDNEVGRVIRRVPGVLEGTDLPANYRHATDYCEHCAVNRRRNTVFILRNRDSGEWKQVGRNCLGQFLGGIDPTDIVAYAEMLISFDGLCGGAQDADFFGFGGQSDHLDLQSTLVFTGYVIKQLGWLSRSKARELSSESGVFGVRATADVVMDAYFSLPAYKAEETKAVMEAFDALSDEAKAPLEIAAEAAIDWVRGTDETERNDYIHNLAVVCGSSAFNRKHLGIAASLLIAHQNAMGRKAEKENAAVLTHIGTVGQRQTFQLKLKDVKYWSNNFGMTTALFFNDVNNNIVVWKASRDPELNVGTTYEVTGGVKAHTVYRDKPQTELTRCKIVGAVGM